MGGHGKNDNGNHVIQWNEKNNGSFKRPASFSLQPPGPPEKEECLALQNDLQRATDIARSMVTEYGMSNRLGLVTYERPRQPKGARYPLGAAEGPR